MPNSRAPVLQHSVSNAMQVGRRNETTRLRRAQTTLKKKTHLVKAKCLESRGSSFFAGIGILVCGSFALDGFG